MSGENQNEIKSRPVVRRELPSIEGNSSGSGSRRALPSPINSAAYLQNVNSATNSESVKERTEAFLKKETRIISKITN